MSFMFLLRVLTAPKPPQPLNSATTSKSTKKKKKIQLLTSKRDVQEHINSNISLNRKNQLFSFFRKKNIKLYATLVDDKFVFIQNFCLIYTLSFMSISIHIFFLLLPLTLTYFLVFILIYSFL